MDRLDGQRGGRSLRKCLANLKFFSAMLLALAKPKS